MFRVIFPLGIFCPKNIGNIEFFQIIVFPCPNFLLGSCNVLYTYFLVVNNIFSCFSVSSSPRARIPILICICTNCKFVGGTTTVHAKFSWPPYAFVKFSRKQNIDSIHEI